MIKIVKKNQWLQNIFLALIIIIPTFYAYLNARLYDPEGDCVFLIIFFIALTRYLLKEKEKNYYNKAVLFFFWAYLSLSIISLILPLSDYSSYKWFEISVVRIGCGVLIVFVLVQLTTGERNFLRFVLFPLCLFTAIYAILYSHDITQKSWLSFLTPFEVIDESARGPLGWNSKYFASWLVILTWGTVGIHWGKTFKNKILATLTLLVSAFAVFVLPSEGAMLAMVLSSILFFMLNILPPEKSYYLYLFTSLTAVVLPFILVLYFALFPISSYEPAPRDKSLIMRSVITRGYIYAYSSDLVRQKPFMGHGFGSARHLPFPQGKNVHKSWGENLPGGHPHNLVFLFLIEHGLIGFLFLLTSTIYFYNYLYSRAETHSNAIVALPLLLSFQIIFSLSYSIWQTDNVLLITIFFLLMKLNVTESDIER